MTITSQTPAEIKNAVTKVYQTVFVYLNADRSNEGVAFVNNINSFLDISSPTFSDLVLLRETIYDYKNQLNNRPILFRAATELQTVIATIITEKQFGYTALNNALATDSDEIVTFSSAIGNESLETNSTTIIGGINELRDEIINIQTFNSEFVNLNTTYAKAWDVHILKNDLDSYTKALDVKIGAVRLNENLAYEGHVGLSYADILTAIKTNVDSAEDSYYDIALAIATGVGAADDTNLINLLWLDMSQRHTGPRNEKYLILDVSAVDGPSIAADIFRNTLYSLSNISGVQSMVGLLNAILANYADINYFLPNHINSDIINNIQSAVASLSGDFTYLDIAVSIATSINASENLELIKNLELDFIHYATYGHETSSDIINPIHIQSRITDEFLSLRNPEFNMAMIVVNFFEYILNSSSLSSQKWSIALMAAIEANYPTDSYSMMVTKINAAVTGLTSANAVANAIATAINAADNTSLINLLELAFDRVNVFSGISTVSGSDAASITVSIMGPITNLPYTWMSSIKQAELTLIDAMVAYQEESDFSYPTILTNMKNAVSQLNIDDLTINNIALAIADTLNATHNSDLVNYLKLDMESSELLASQIQTNFATISASDAPSIADAFYKTLDSYTVASASATALLNAIELEHLSDVTILSAIGSDNLTTEARSIIGGINELDAEIDILQTIVGSGELSGTMLGNAISSDLTQAVNDIVYAVGSSVLTTENSNIADAINELEGEIDTLQTIVGSGELSGTMLGNTVSSDITNAVNDLNYAVGSSILHTEASNVADAINELEGEIDVLQTIVGSGELSGTILGNAVSSDLTNAVNDLNYAVGSSILTTEASNVADAINELEGEIDTLQTIVGSGELSGTMLGNAVSSDLTQAVNDLNYVVGSSVLTTEASNVADAINELEDEIDILQTNVTNISNDLNNYAQSTTMTALQAIVGSGELSGTMLGNAVSSDVTNAVNDLNYAVGSSILNTEASNIADAINELEGEIDTLQTDVADINNDLSNYAKTSDLENLSTYAQASDLENLSTYALASTVGNITLNENLAYEGHIAVSYADILASIKSNVAALPDSASYHEFAVAIATGAGAADDTDLIDLLEYNYFDYVGDDHNTNIARRKSRIALTIEATASTIAYATQQIIWSLHLNGASSPLYVRLLSAAITNYSVNNGISYANVLSGIKTAVAGLSGGFTYNDIAMAIVNSIGAEENTALINALLLEFYQGADSDRIEYNGPDAIYLPSQIKSSIIPYVSGNSGPEIALSLHRFLPPMFYSNDIGFLSGAIALSLAIRDYLGDGGSLEAIKTAVANLTGDFTNRDIVETITNIVFIEEEEVINALEMDFDAANLDATINQAAIDNVTGSDGPEITVSIYSQVTNWYLENNYNPTPPSAIAGARELSLAIKNYHIDTGASYEDILANINSAVAELPYAHITNINDTNTGTIAAAVARAIAGVIGASDNINLISLLELDLTTFTNVINVQTAITDNISGTDGPTITNSIYAAIDWRMTSSFLEVAYLAKVIEEEIHSLDTSEVTILSVIGGDDLVTDARTIIGGINELEDEIDALQTKVGSTALTGSLLGSTVASDVTNAVNDLNYAVGSSILHTEASNIADAINELRDEIDTLQTDVADINNDLSNYAKTSDLENLSTYAQASDLENLSTYALASTVGNITLNENLAYEGHKPVSYAEILTAIKANVAALPDSASYHELAVAIATGAGAEDDTYLIDLLECNYFDDVGEDHNTSVASRKNRIALTIEATAPTIAYATLWQSSLTGVSSLLYVRLLSAAITNYSVNNGVIYAEVLSGMISAVTGLSGDFTYNDIAMAIVNSIGAEENTALINALLLEFYQVADSDRIEYNGPDAIYLPSQIKSSIIAYVSGNSGQEIALSLDDSTLNAMDYNNNIGLMPGAHALSLAIRDYLGDGGSLEAIKTAVANLTGDFTNRDIVETITNIVDIKAEEVINALEMDFDAANLDATINQAAIDNVTGSDGPEITVSIYSQVTNWYLENFNPTTPSAITGARELSLAIKNYHIDTGASYEDILANINSAVAELPYAHITTNTGTIAAAVARAIAGVIGASDNINLISLLELDLTTFINPINAQTAITDNISGTDGPTITNSIYAAIEWSMTSSFLGVAYLAKAIEEEHIIDTAEVTILSAIGSDDLTTDARSIIGAINELEGEIDTLQIVVGLNSLNGNILGNAVSSDVTNAVNDLIYAVGSNILNTEASNVADAINELDMKIGYNNISPNNFAYLNKCITEDGSTFTVAGSVFSNFDTEQNGITLSSMLGLHTITGYIAAMAQCGTWQLELRDHDLYLTTNNTAGVTEYTGCTQVLDMQMANAYCNSAFDMIV